VKTIITLDVLAGTMQWIAWGEHFAPLSEAPERRLISPNALALISGSLVLT
jgi:hypothetical protein